MHRPSRYAVHLLILGIFLIGLVGTGLRQARMSGPVMTSGSRGAEGDAESGRNRPGGTHGSTASGAPPASEARDLRSESDAAGVMDGFSRWLSTGTESAWSLNNDPRFVEEGVELARARREILRRLIQSDPRSALALAIPWRLRQKVPESVRMELEEVVAGTGDLEVLCVWRLPGRPGSGAPYVRTFTMGGRVFRAFVSGRREGQTTTRGSALHGIAVDDMLAIAEWPLRVLEAAEADAEIRNGRVTEGAVCAVTGGASTVLAGHGGNLLPLADAGVAADLNRKLASVEPGFRTSQEPPAFREWTHGVKRLLFMRARFPDDVREPISDAEAADVMRLANEYFVRTSFNNMALISTIGPLVMLPQPKLYYSARGPGALMADARVATREAGFEPDNYELDMVRFESVPGFDWGGLGSVGGKGVWLQGSGLGVICHELGHNLGLSHANFWNTVRPELPDNPQNLPFDTDSLVGIDSVIGPGDDVEYGDPFDVMGSGGGASAHFTGLHKYLLGWLPEASVLTVTTSGVYRIYAHDGGVLGAGATHILRVRKDTERLYWIDARSGPADNPWQSRGVELHWNNWHQAIASCQLLDTTPGSRHGKDDAALTLGRMYSDEAAQIHVTTLARGVEGLNGVAVPYYDVAVRVGASAGNRAPELTLELSSTGVGVNEPVELRALATDLDGDELTYAWDLGEGLPGENRAEMSRAWSQPGDYVVRCEVSDRRGGRAARHAVVRVGGAGGLRIQGRVLDQTGEPLLGVRVHNGQAGTNSPYAPEYRWAYTDSDGRYTMVGMQPGSFEVGAVLAGYEVRPLNFSRPLILNQFTGVGVDFIAAARTQVNVTSVAEGDESLGRAAQVRVARSGRTNETLRVYFRVGGTAAPGEDYEPWSLVEVQTNVIPTVLQPVTQTLELGYVDLGPGLLSTNVTFPVLRDSTAEGDETVVVTLVYPVSRTEISETATNTFEIPGWEVLADNGRDTWFQTRPQYQLGPRDEAIVRILEGGTAPPTTLAILALERVTSENPGDSASFLVTRTGRRPDGPLVVPLSVSGTATAGDDYSALPAYLRIPADAEAVRLTVEVLDDRFVEGNETVTVGLGDGLGYGVGGRSATVTIVDNDLPWVTVTVVDPVVAENGSGARVTFQRSGDLGGILEVDYLLGGTAVAGVDYSSLAGRVVIPAGAATVTIVVAPIDDGQREGDETVVVRLGDSPVYNVVQPGHGTVTVRDDEFPTVTVEAVDEEAVEGNDDPGTWVIRRTGSTAEALEVLYRFGGSAQHQADFIAIGDRITIPARQSLVVLTAMPIDDAIREDPETIAIELLEGPGYTVGTPARAAVQLLDNDDSDLAVGFALLSSRGLESRTDPELVVRISGNPDDGPENAVTVAWELLGGTATSGEDFVLTNGTLVFAYSDPDGDTPWTNRVGTIPLQVLDDLLFERDESVLIRLRIAPTELPSDDPEVPPTLVTNGFLDVFTVHTYTIADDDASEITVAAVQATAVEGGAVPGLFAIQRTGRTNTAQVVTFDLSGLASAGSDYLDVSRFVTIPAGQTQVEVAILPVDDPVEEYRENVRLTLLGAPGARLGGTRFADVQIDDNDGTIEFAMARWVVSEGDGEARILVRRSGDTNLAATANFEVRGGTAMSGGAGGGTGVGDFWPTNGVLHFAPGDRVKGFGVVLVDDLEIEEPETILLALSRGTGLFPLGGQNTATLTIVDNDGLISTGTNVPAAIESEFEVLVTLERTGPLEEALVVEFLTRDVTASAELDYVASSGSVVFEPGEASVELRIQLRNDEWIEGDEIFVIDLFAVDGATVGEVAVTIVDDDCALEFSVGAAEVDEDGGVVELTVIRIGSPLNPVVVSFQTMSGTASESEDFVRAAGMLRFLGNRFETLTNGTGEVVFLLGETNKVIPVPIVNDADGERDEVFDVVLSDARPGFVSEGIPFVRLGALTNVTVTIRDNEAPGRVDDQFQPGLGADAPVRALGLQADGKVLVGGDFGTFDGVVLPRLARLHADGFVDQSFNPGLGFNGSVLAVEEIAEGRILVGGTFSRVDGGDRPFLVRLEPDGTRSATGQTSVEGPVRAIVVGSEVFIGGAFSRVNGQARSGVARLGADGGVDGDFDPRGTGTPDVRALLESDDGGIWVGGGFENWAGSGFRHVVKLGPDGALDRTIPGSLSPNGPVNGLARASDGTIYLVGTFTVVGGLPRAGVARLLAGGGIDAGFDPGAGANEAVFSTAGDGVGRVLFGGAFDAFADMPAGRFVRVDAEGSVDATFFRGTGANGAVRSLVVQPNGAILLGGDFTEVNGRPRRRVARIHADEKFAEGFMEFAEPVVTVSEAAGEVVIEVRRTGSAKGEARVGYRTQDITAETGLDYDGATGELVFVAGQTLGTFRVGIRDDALAEGSEGVTLTLFDAVGAEIGRQGTAVLVIADDEAAIAWDLVRMDVAENEGIVRMIVRRSGPTAGESRVRVSTQSGSAVDGEDYVGLSEEVVLAPGVATIEIAIGMVNDDRVEGMEGFQVVLSNPVGGVELGSQSVMDVTIVDDDRLPTHYTLTIQPAPGGVVQPGGGRFPTNTVVTLNAVPDHGFEFARWEGTVVSADNPFALTMDRNQVLAARFRPRDYLETFESGGLEALPWRTEGEGDAPWRATQDSASTGMWSARSGSVTNRGVSVLRLEMETPAGGGSFDFRTETEAGWDFLEFLVNGELREQWSGVNGWQTYGFNVAAGQNRLEWRYSRDPSFGGSLDAVWIDNLDLPEVAPPIEPPRLRWVGGAGECAIEIRGEAGRVHTLESSVDLRIWTVVTSASSTEKVMVLKDPGCRSVGARYYRVRVD